MSGLPERLARDAAWCHAQCFCKGRESSPCGACADLIPTIAAAIRAALDEASALARDGVISHRESRTYPGHLVPDGIATREWIAAAIDGLKA